MDSSILLKDSFDIYNIKNSNFLTKEEILRVIIIQDCEYDIKDCKFTDNDKKISFSFKNIDVTNKGIISSAEIEYLIKTYGEIKNERNIETFLLSADIDFEGNINYEDYFK